VGKGKADAIALLPDRGHRTGCGDFPVCGEQRDILDQGSGRDDAIDRMVGVVGDLESPKT